MQASHLQREPMVNPRNPCISCILMEKYQKTVMQQVHPDVHVDSVREWTKKE